MRLEHTEKPVTDEEFDVFERFLDQTLPDVFEDHCRTNNGGWVPEGSDNSPGVHGFNPISRGTRPVERLIDDLQLTDGRYGEVADRCCAADGRVAGPNWSRRLVRHLAPGSSAIRE
ncbi:hypothetical protein SAMN02982929_01860 [Saccharopolyspora kobensis]|uniref:Knr4/Smi1-like domain-containing protein n=1 Tax=Saccharopolyspora kobensis TaxID=146035 RepID=A0A1H5ZJL2_9PSEU|nr:SMI1/KNR4 family protein [Saccharopolyspora kobensis]SEG36733.1 hypothetical protein SAMN02982929_01860 [Saccharopolyspora kobensis]SFF20681.1 hypothetical protein SAMN05216506_12217 [Saccharopolyspora kobensis]